MNLSYIKLRPILFVLITLLIFVAVGFRLDKKVFSRSKQGNSSDSLSQSIKHIENNLNTQTPLLVEATTAKKDKLILTITGTGQTEPYRKLLITSRVNGVLKKLNVVENQFVSPKDVLARIDDSEYQLVLRESQEALLKAKLDYITLKSDTVFKFSDTILSDTIDAVWKLNFQTTIKDRISANKVGLTQAMISVERAKLNINYCTLTPPFAGIIVNLKVVEGEWVSPGKEICTLLDISRLKVVIDVIESEIALLNIGQKVKLKFSAYSQENFEGVITSISPVIDVQKKAGSIIVELPNYQYRLKVGMFVQAQIESQIFNNKLIVPKEAILTRDQRKLVFVIENNLAKWRYVQTGLENEQYVEILDGVKEGEMVITNGHFTLSHDAPVKVIGSR